MSEFDDLYGDSTPDATPDSTLPVSEFDQLYDDTSGTSKVHSNLLGAAGVNPDDFAERQKISRELNVPVALLPPTAEAQAELLRKNNKPEDIAAQNPALAKWLENERNANLIGGDVRSLRKLESTTRQVIGKAPTAENLTRGIATQFKEQFTQMKAGVKFRAAGDVPVNPEEQAIQMERLKARQDITSGALVPRFNAQTKTFEYINPSTGLPGNTNEKYTALTGPRSDAGKLAAAVKQQRLEALQAWAESQKRVSEDTPQIDNAAGRVLYGAVSGAVASAPLMAASIAVPTAAPALFGLSSTLQALPKYKLRGATDAEAELGAVLEGASSGLTNLLPIPYIANALGKSGVSFREILAGSAIREAPTEVLDTLNAMIIDTAIANPDKTWGEMMAELPEQLTIAATGALVTSGAIGGAHKAAGLFAHKSSQAQQRVTDHDVLTGISAQASSEPLRKRNKEAFHEFVTNMAEDGSTLSDVYVSAVELEKLAQQPGGAELLASLPGVADQLQEQVALRGDVRIPLADYATHIAGSELDATLIPKLKTSVDGLTYDEAQSFFQTASKDMATQAEDLVAENAPVLTKEEFEAQLAEQQPKPAERRTGAPRRVDITKEGEPSTSAQYVAVLAEADDVMAKSKQLRERGPERRAVERRSDSRTRDTLQKAQAAGEFTEQQVQKILELARTQPVELKEKLGAARIREATAGAEDLPAAQAEVKSLENQLAQRSAQVEEALKETPAQQKLKAAKKNTKLPKTYAQYLAAHPSRRAVLQADLDKVEETLLDQFVKSGRYTRAVARANVMPLRDFYATQAKRMGIMPTELYAKYPLKITPEGLVGYNQFAGVKAKTANLLSLDAAKEMVAVGADTDKVRETTGWHKGVDGKWRFEISDSDAKLKVKGTFGDWAQTHDVTQLGSIIKHDKLYAAYPWLQNFKVSPLPLKYAEKGVKAAYDRENNRLLASKALTGEELLSSLMHEAQHAIQNEEQFASGGNPEVVKGLLQHLDEGMSAKEAYARLAGEIEARNTQARLKMSESDRRVFSPDMTADRDAADAIVIFNGKVNSLQPANLYNQEHRGSFDPNTLTMSFLNSADLSTPLHESGHAYLELLSNIAREVDAPAGIKADVQKALDWFGVKDLAAWDAMTLEQKRPHHEQWAESYERYLFENTAPSPELRDVFARFSVWLTQVYKSLAEFLKTHPAAGKLDDEIRGVFDRMLASSEGIATAEQLRGYENIFEGAKVPDKESAKYAEQADDATTAAVADMRKRSLRDMQWASNAKSRVLKELQKEANFKRATIREEVAKEVAEEPVEKVRAALLTKEPTAIKINTVILKEIFPSIDVNLLRGMTHAENGMHPDRIADLYGFQSGVELITTLVDEESTASKISGLTDKRMLEENGELVDPQSIEHAANLAVHNENRARAMATGLKILTKSPVPAAQLARAAKFAAKAAIGAKRIRDVRPAQYEVAEARANREVLQNAARKPEEAVAAQRAALLNNRLVRAATDALSEVDKGIAHSRQLARKVAQENMRGAYLAQLNALLDRFDIRTSRSLSEIDAEKTPLAEWLASESERLSAVMPDLPAWVLNEGAPRKSYKDMTVDEFRGLMDAVKGLELLARREEKQYQAIRDMKFSEERQAVLDRIREFNPQIFEDGEPLPVSDNFVPSLKNAASLVKEKFAGEFLNPETIVNIMEGGQFGQLHESLLGRLDAGVNRKASRLVKVIQQMTPLLNKYSLLEKRAFSTKDIGAIGGTRVTRENVLVVALLHGSQDGRERLENHGWSRIQQAEAIKLLDAKDLDLVEGIWSLFDNSLWPDLKALNERTRGKAPPKIPPLGYQVRGRDMTGGYFKLKYISKGSAKASRIEQLSATQELLGGSFGATAKTKQGSSTERVEKTDMRPRLDLGAFVEAVHETVHDIELREAVADTARLLKDKKIVAAITNVAGEAGWKTLEQKLEDTAARPINPSGFIEKFSTIARRNTVVTLMSGLGTALQNVTGVFSAMDRVSPGRLLVELARTAPGVFKARYDFALGHSEFLRNYFSSYDRDLQAAASKLQLKGTILPDTATLLWFMGQVNKRIAVMTHNTAFADGMEKFQNDEKKAVEYADHVLRQTQGSGREFDLAQIASGGPLRKLFTMFSSYALAQLGMLVRSGAVNAKLAKTQPALAAALFAKTFLLVFVLPAVITRMIFSGNQPEDEDEVHKYGMALLKYGLSMVPLVRDVGNYAIGKIDPATQDYGMKLTPVQSALEGVVKGPIAIADILAGEGTDQDTKDAIMGVSYATGLPGNLIKNTVTGVDAWMEGEGSIGQIIYGKKAE